MTNSESNKILVLGDCIATGQNLIWSEVLDNDGSPVDTLYDAEDDNREKRLHSWLLKNHNGKINFDNLMREVYKVKIKKEKGMSWVSKIPNSVNLSVVGETFTGMHKKLKNFLSDNHKPSTVLITCIARGHRGVVINHGGQKYVVKREIALLNREQYIWPGEIYDKFVAIVKQQEKFGKEFQQRKNKKSLDLLIRLLDQHQIPHKFLLFRKYNQYLSNQYVDLSDLMAQYRNSNDDGESVIKKLHAQNDIAEKVMAVIEQS